MKTDRDSMPLKELNVLELFNLNDKDIKSVNIHHSYKGINLEVTLEPRPTACPVCGTATAKINNYVTRAITHSVLNHVPCYIKYHARRYKCPCCNKTFYENNPFTFKGMKVSLMTVYNVLNDLKLPNETFHSAAKRYYVSPTTVVNIFDRHVHISRKKLPEVILIDEVYGFKSDDSNYVCVLLDFKTHDIIDILPSRKKADLINYFTLIPREERENVKTVCTDMWETYRNVSKLVFPNSCHTVDKFHLLQEYSKKMNRIRINTMNQYKIPKNIKKEELTEEELLKLKERNQKYYILKKFDFLLFTGDEKLFDPNRAKKYNRVLEKYVNYYDIREEIININPELETAVYFKDELSSFFKQAKFNSAAKLLNTLILELNTSNIKEMQEYASTLIKWKKSIINSFKPSSNGATVTSGAIESINKTIKTIKRNSNGYTSWKRFRNRVLYVVNKDATYHMYPKGEYDDEQHKL